ncbi:RluA family pseudouridine synthase [Chlamydiifrater phoenicopteri]|uniref:RluA family pseudouridine synthase n=1 Tax=Chlamydiifrater phoenicopteri TaxID=2681469 RepID=UPI001BD1313D|nr:RluA family pseudouridine synthase [Chlamydiifrater phoenicopteri]
MITKIVAKVEQPSRLLSFVKKQLSAYPFANAEDCLRFQHCRVNGLVERFGSYRLFPEDVVSIFVEDLSEPAFASIPILFESEGYAIYHKPPRISTERLVELAQGFVVHRLDRDTSGCLIIGKEFTTTQLLQKLFKQRKVEKQYIAITKGRPNKSSGVLQTFTKILHRRQGALIMGNSREGQETITRWRVKKSSANYSLIYCFPITGRTHQIRLHMKTLGCPIVGDVDYGSKTPPENIFRPLLHSLSLQFFCPVTQKKISTSCPHNFPSLSSLEDKKKIF